MRPKITRNDADFKKLCENLRIVYPLVSSCFTTLNQNVQELMNNQLHPQMKGTGNKRILLLLKTMTLLLLIFKNIVDEHVENLTITEKEITETERLTRGQTKVEPSNKVKAILYANLVTEVWH